MYFCSRCTMCKSSLQITGKITNLPDNQIVVINRNIDGKSERSTVYVEIAK